ncbi:MAG: hypothetical protein M0T73_15000 [Deltaproteobacteria bacterium]|nr:hypothetical protein [Deltaproteobacteria bacterium]
MENSKKWWASKTIWINLVALSGSIAISLGCDSGRWAEISTVTLAAVNLVLRLITREEISLDGNI